MPRLKTQQVYRLRLPVKYRAQFGACIVTPWRFGSEYLRCIEHYPSGLVDTQHLSSLLCRVGFDVLECVIRNEWTPLQRVEAFVWAARNHLRASDNAVEVPPIPAWIRDWGFPWRGDRHEFAERCKTVFYGAAPTRVAGKFTARDDQILCTECGGVHS
jgi:hypothetical protein